MQHTGNKGLSDDHQILMVCSEGMAAGRASVRRVTLGSSGRGPTSVIFRSNELFVFWKGGNGEPEVEKEKYEKIIHVLAICRGDLVLSRKIPL